MNLCSPIFSVLADALRSVSGTTFSLFSSLNVSRSNSSALGSTGGTTIMGGGGVGGGDGVRLRDSGGGIGGVKLSLPLLCLAG